MATQIGQTSNKGLKQSTAAASVEGKALVTDGANTKVKTKPTVVTVAIVKTVTKIGSITGSAIKDRPVREVSLVKLEFGYRTLRYQGLPKNTRQSHILFALSNSWTVRGKLLAMAA